VSRGRTVAALLGTLLVLVAVTATGVGAKMLGAARVAPAPAALGTVQVAPLPPAAAALAVGPPMLPPKGPAGPAKGCDEDCAPTPRLDLSAAVKVDAKDGDAEDQPTPEPPPAVEQAPAPPVEEAPAPVEAVPPTVEEPAPTVEEPELPAEEPEPPTEEPELPAEEPAPPTEEPELPAEEPAPPVEEPEIPPEEVEPPGEPSEPPTDPGCPLTATQSLAPIAMSLPGCQLVATDPSAAADPLPFWGSIECAEDSRYSYLESGGDPHATANGASGDSGYRRLAVRDGDDFYGERCELGLNDHESGPTTFYHEGQHRVTYYSERLPTNFPLSTSNWQTVMQMKQTQPSDDNCCGPQLEMEARQDHWIVVESWNSLWEFPARRNTWTRFAWDVYYSQDADKGWLQVSADLNGDGDFNDANERSPVLHAATLRTEPEGSNGTSDGLAPGDPIPSHLRVGIYHDPEISCAAPVECAVEVDNVQVMQPSS
jgi:hypothetical protein